MVDMRLIDLSNGRAPQADTPATIGARLALPAGLLNLLAFSQLPKRAVDVVSYESRSWMRTSNGSANAAPTGLHGDLLEQVLSIRNARMECLGCKGTIVSH
jgi:hypothetical protein